MIAMQWHEHAVCKSTDDPIFFPTQQEEKAARVAAARYCRQCPVLVQCMNSALENKEFGIWAGTSTELRVKLRRKRNRKRCPGCLNERLSFHGDTAACLSCGLSWTLEDA